MVPPLASALGRHVGFRVASSSRRPRRRSLLGGAPTAPSNFARGRSAPFSSTSEEVNVAFVGLGNMGKQMALNLASRKPEGDALPPLQLTVHDAKQDNVANFLESLEKAEGVTSLSTANDLQAVGGSDPDFVITSLPTCEASEAVVGGVARHLDNDSGKGCVFVDTSTISPNISKKLHQLVTSLSPQNDYVDAPVSGGVKGAAEATLTFMVGCHSPETFSRIQPLLRRLGKGIIPCGGSGSGSAVKLCNNAALAAQMVGICEAMNLGEKLGVDPAVLAGVFNVSTAKCWSSEVNNPHPAAARDIGSGASANGYEGGFGTALMLKDLNLAVDAGEEEGLAQPVAGLTRDLYRMATLHGYGEKDFGVMLEFLKGVKQ